MAIPAHCAYCFEILTADLEDREPLEYRQVLDLWAQYESLSRSKVTHAQRNDEHEHDPDVHDGDDLEHDSDIDGSGEAEEDEDEDEDEDEQEEVLQPARSKLSLPSISRLQASSPQRLPTQHWTPPRNRLPRPLSSASVVGALSSHLLCRRRRRKSILTS